MMFSIYHRHSDHYRYSGWVWRVSRTWCTTNRQTLDRTPKDPLFWGTRVYVESIWNSVSNGNVFIEFEGNFFVDHWLSLTCVHVLSLGLRGLGLSSEDYLWKGSLSVGWGTDIDRIWWSDEGDRQDVLTTFLFNL